MAEILLDDKDITEIFKNNLKIENMVKSISSIFLNERFYGRIDYKPYFQRHYVWDKEKATYFIESIFLGTEIPPLVLFDNGKKNEVIDGRQRYETILRFLQNDLVLMETGLKSLKSFGGKKFCDFSQEIKDEFEDTKLRILQCSVVNEPLLAEHKEDKIKKEIFRRYNSGIVPLKKEEIQRAEFIHDEITKSFSRLLDVDSKLFNNVCSLFLPKRQSKLQKRDKINKLLSKIRTLITLPVVPINNYANSSSKAEDIGVYYRNKVTKYDINELINEFKTISDIIIKIKNKLTKKSSLLADNILLYECSYWIFSIIIRNFSDIYKNINVNDFIEYISEVEINRTLAVFDTTGSHYHKAIKDRYEFISQYFMKAHNVNMDKYIKNSNDFTTTIKSETKELQSIEINKYKLNKPEPTSMTIEDICKFISKSRFLIRPDYQRSEVKNTNKSSYLLESIMLAMKIPPIFIYKRADKIYEVIDGQQRLLSILGFLGKEYLDENNKKVISIKHKFKLKDLRILDKLNDSNVDTIDKDYVNKILDFQLDVVEIDYALNQTFESIDLFLRLNTKPYPIGEHTFEMWNSYVNKDIILAIRTLTDKYSNQLFKLGKEKDTRMNNEELITSLAYLDYKNIKGNSASILDIYVRTGKINARIKKKADITRVLNDASKNNIGDFITSVNNVELFINKIKILTNDDFGLLNKMFVHKYSRNTSRTNQNFYLLWLMMKDTDIDQIKGKRKHIYKDISDLYIIMQNYSQEKSLDPLHTLIRNVTS